MATSEDPEELLYVWKAWRDATGKRMRKKYVEYVGLMKEVALLNGKSFDKALPSVLYPRDLPVDVVSRMYRETGEIQSRSPPRLFSHSHPISEERKSNIDRDRFH